MQSLNRQVKKILQERYKLPRSPAPVEGALLGIRPMFWLATAVILAVLIWLVLGLLTYPVS
jgi:hypothetical protein